MKKTGAQIIVELLKRENISLVAGIPGGSILPLYDEIAKSNLRHILVRHEQAAGFLAQGIARTTGKPAVCLATSGPGAMNLLTAIADARSDSIPIIAITGQVNMSLIGTDAFQEADTFGLSFPITKHSVMVKKPEDLLWAIPQAFAIAMNGRPGPVLVDVPRDVQTAVCEFDSYPENIELHDIRYHTKPAEYAEKMDEITDLLVLARRPVLFCGGGCNSPAASTELKKFLRSYRLPVVTSLMGLGSVGVSSPMFAGMVGMHGAYSANVAMHDSDLVLAAGVRFDDRATGLVEEFCPKAKIVHIDVDAAEVNKMISSDIAVVADVESVFPILVQLAAEKQEKFASAWQAAEARAMWLEKIINIKNEKSAAEENASASKTTSASGSHSANGNSSANGSRSTNGGTLINPRTFIKNIPLLAEKAGTLAKDIIVTTDVGQHQMFAAQYYPVENPRTFITSGSLGTMGFGLPAAIGAALANETKRIVCFSGDGSIMMNIQELVTLAELNLAVTVILFENGTLGMVYQQQKFLFDKNYSASIFSSSPDFLTIARGFGIEGADASTDANWYEKAFDPKRKKKPFFVRVPVCAEENVLPFVPGGKANIDAIMS